MLSQIAINTYTRRSKVHSRRQTCEFVIQLCRTQSKWRYSLFCSTIHTAASLNLGWIEDDEDENENVEETVKELKEVLFFWRIKTFFSFDKHQKICDSNLDLRFKCESLVFPSQILFFALWWSDGVWCQTIYISIVCIFVLFGFIFGLYPYLPKFRCDVSAI